MRLTVVLVILLSTKPSSSTFTFNKWVCNKHLFLLRARRGMGRSVPPWRTRVENELQHLTPYRRALSSVDQAAFDALLDAVRERRAAGGMLPAVNTWQPTVLSMMVGLMGQLQQLSDRIQTLEERHRHD